MSQNTFNNGQSAGYRPDCRDMLVVVCLPWRFVYVSGTARHDRALLPLRGGEGAVASLQVLSKRNGATTFGMPTR
jgi:hypothetical protein